MKNNSISHNTKLKEAQKALKEAQKKHKESNDTNLWAALEHKEKTVQESDDPKMAKKAAAAVEALIQQHQTLESYTKIKWVTKPWTGGRLQQVDLPKRDEDGNVIHDQEGTEVWEVLLEVEDIHKVILEQNKCHFHEADETPFAGGAKNTVLYDLIGYTGMSQADKDVVEGSFLEKHGDELKDILPETEQLIKELSMPEEIKVIGKQIDYEITEETFFISGFKKWKESTLTSPSGCHLGVTLQSHCYQSGYQAEGARARTSSWMQDKLHWGLGETHQCPTTICFSQNGALRSQSWLKRILGTLE